jgi:hypothetical protein
VSLGGDGRARERARVCEMRQGRESGCGRGSKRVRAHGQATWAFSMVGAWTWVSSGCGEDKADKAPRRPHGAERERAREQMVHGADKAGP